MEKIAQHKSIVKEELAYYQSIKIYNAPQLARHLIINATETEFLLMDVGWFKDRYISDLVFHLEIKNDKVWVHADNTDIEIAEKLAQAGIPKSDIGLAFVPSYAKDMVEYAVM